MGDKPDFKKIHRILKSVWNSKHSSFYKNKYKQAGINLIDIRSWSDFEKLPYLTKDELLRTDPNERLYMGKSSVNHTLITSGTTTVIEPLILLTNEKMYSNLGSVKQGVKEKISSTILLLPVFQLANARNVMLYPEMSKKHLIIFGDINNLNLSAKLAKTASIDSIFTSPTTLYHFLPELKKIYDLRKVKLIVLRGEYCSEQKLKLFKKEFKNAYFEIFYGTIETSRLGYRCKYLAKKAPRLYHPMPSIYYEIDKLSGDQLIISSLSSAGPFPMIRYLTGDVVRIKKISCQCGVTIQLEVFGRTENDVAKFSGVTLYSYLIENALQPFERYIKTEQFQMHIYEQKIKGELTLKLKLELIPQLESSNIAKLKPELEKGIADNLYLSSKTKLSELITKGVFKTLEVAFVKEVGSSFKQKKIISHII